MGFLPPILASLWSTLAAERRSFHVEPLSNQVLDQCPICNGWLLLPHLRVRDNSVSREFFTLVLCSECGFCFTNPRPSSEQIGRYYEDPKYISHGGTGKGIQEKVYRLARRLAIKAKHRLVSRYFSNGSVLDIGCGTGEYLAYLKEKGYRCTGVEPSLRAREQAIRHYSLNVLPDISNIPSQEQFVVVSLWHVLEHVHNPRKELGCIHSLLRTGGVLILAVPDRESWDAIHYGPDWAAYDVPRHLSHFRRQDMKRLLVSQGFELVQVRGMWFDAPYVSLLSERYRQAHPITAFVRGMLFGATSNLLALLGRRPTSSSIFIARKL